MSENHRLQTEEENKRSSTDMSSDAGEGSSKPRISDVFSSSYRAAEQLESSTPQPLINAVKHTVKPEQEFVRRADVQREASRRGHRQNKSISAAHPAIYLNTHSHKLLRRAIRIWKMPVPMMNGTGSSKPKPRNFQEQLKQVEMLRTRPGDPGARTRSVRDLQLGSGTDSSPPSSRRFREQLRWYRMLSRRGRRRRPREGQLPPAGSCWVKGSGEDPDDPVIRAPERRTSRRLWRRKLDSSSSETSPITPRPDTHTRKHIHSPINPRPDTHTRKHTHSPITPRPDTHTRKHIHSPINPRPDTHTRKHTHSPITPRPDTHTRKHTHSPITPRPDTHTKKHTHSPITPRPDTHARTHTASLINPRPDTDTRKHACSPITPRPDTHTRTHTCSPITPRPDTHTRTHTCSPITPRPDTHTRKHTHSPITPRPDTHTKKHTRVSFCIPDESKLHFLDINSNLRKEASASEQKTVQTHDLKLAVQSSEKLIPQSATGSSLPKASSVPQLKISEDIKHPSDSPQPSHTPSHTHTPASSQCCVKWKSVLLQRFSVSFENQWRAVLPETHPG